MTTMAKYLFVGLALCIILVGCTGETEAPPAPELIRSPAAEIDTATITRGPLVGLERRTGVTRYLSEPLYFDRPVAGFGEFHVVPGESVTEGQLLVTLDTELIDEQIEEQMRRIANMRRDHALANDIRQLDIDIMVLEHANRVNQVTYYLDQDAAEALEAQSLNIDRARLELRQQRDRHAVELRQAETRLEDLRTRRQRAELRAPYDGQITNMRDFVHGQHISVAQPLLYITDASRVVIEAVNKPFLQDWPQPGPGGMPPDPWRPNTIRRALYTIAYIDGEIFEVEYISVSLEERPFRPVRFEILSDNPPPAGKYVSIHFYTHHIEDALLIPDNAIFFAGAQPYVYLVINGDLIYTEIRLEGRTSIMGAVSIGLEEGDLVLVR